MDEGKPVFGISDTVPKFMLLHEHCGTRDPCNILEDPPIKTMRASHERRLDDIVFMAVSLLDCSLAMITDASENKRVLACAVRGDGENSFAINDAPQRWLDPVDAERVGLLFYCGFPLRTAAGDNIGHLGVYDVDHRKVGQMELDMMLRLSRIAAALLESVGGALTADLVD